MTAAPRRASGKLRTVTISYRRIGDRITAVTSLESSVRHTVFNFSALAIRLGKLGLKFTCDECKQGFDI